MCVALVIQHAKLMRCIILSFVTYLDVPFFLHISNGRIFEKKKKVAEHKMCLWRFSIQILYETFLILRRIQRDIIINVQRSSCRVPVILIRFSGQTFEIHRYAPHYDVSVNDGPHIRRWSHKIMIL